ncbi:neuronal acetylcholine receptor subunit alpha-5-like [Mya arenaria]|uniref:neuronal acetylcholine receptor subunit alpha-5-like n=1 Tax=Mya arenaria TaxID=6604 RepID=UPI0022E00B97|nr:neuronal acetylcholine receptor subunit alpha-5-like [Mya arenaria]
MDNWFALLLVGIVYMCADTATSETTTSSTSNATTDSSATQTASSTSYSSTSNAATDSSATQTASSTSYSSTSNATTASSTTQTASTMSYSSTSNATTASSTTQTASTMSYPSTSNATTDSSTTQTASTMSYSITTNTSTESPYTSTTANCNVNYTADAKGGSFTSLNYPYDYINSMDCNIWITSPTDTAVVLIPGMFNMEDEKYCQYDSFSVYDGASSSATLLGQYCGTSFPASLESSGNVMYIHVVSDWTVTASGYIISYATLDTSYPYCKSEYTEITATASTGPAPTFSNSQTPYSSNTDEYFLVVKGGKSTGDIILNLQSSSIENSDGCIYDRLVIYDGACRSNTVLATHCGPRLARWELPGTEYLVHFHSDAVIEKDGFVMEYFLGTAGTAEPTTTTTTSGPPVSAEIFLMNDLLTNYSNDVLPVRDLTIPLETKVDLELVGVNGLDEVSQKLTTTVLFTITWTDANIGWPTSRQSGISQLLIPQDDVWKPDVALMNSFTRIKQLGASFMFVVVTNEGACTWRPYQMLDSTCKVDMTYFPYDTQSCDIMISTWASSSNEIETLVGANGMQKHESFVENAEWSLLKISQRNETFNGQFTVVFTLTLQRNQAFTVFYMAIPVVLLTFLCAFTFSMPVCSGEKSGYAITVFLSLIVYVIVTFQKMPENSENLSIFAMYVLGATGLSHISVMISVLEIRFESLDVRYKRVLGCTQTFSKSIIRLQNRLLCIKPEIEEQTAEAGGPKTKSNYAKMFPDDENVEEETPDAQDEDVWIDFVSALDFVCFWVYIIFTLVLALTVFGLLSFN